ncbi:MAG: polysaccharide biosynthesis/export family protein [Blastocatellia bacterium]
MQNPSRSHRDFPYFVSSILAGLFITATALSAFGQAPDPRNIQPQPGVVTPQGKNAQSGAESGAYLIGPGDVVDVRVINHAELSQTARVNDKGMIRVPYVGELRAACLTELQLADLITEKFKRFLNEPQIDVFIKEYQSQPIAVIGAVDKPAQFQLRKRIRLLEALTLVGGPTKDAGNIVHVIHTGLRDFCDGTPAAGQEASEGLSLSSFKVSDLLAGGGTVNIFLMPGDVVSVPEAEQIYVTGYVVKPGPVRMESGATLTQAIAMAGGQMPEAGKKARLLRKKSGSSVVEERIVSLEDIQKKKVADIQLEPGDVIDLPNSAGRSLMQSLLKQVAPTLGVLPIVFRGY